MDRRAGWVVVVVGLLGRPALAVPEPCVYPDATAREIRPSDVSRADNVVGVGLARVRERISPPCRKELDAGNWPELAALLKKVLATGPRYRTEACLLAPPELLPDITEWEQTRSPDDSEYVECAALLFRARRADFDRIVLPRLSASPGLGYELAVRAPPEDRAFILPLLDAATRDRQSGRDGLYRVACAAESMRAAPACQASATLETTWRDGEERRVMSADMAPHVLLAVAYLALVLVIGWRSRRREALTVAASLGSAATAAALAWLILASPTPGAGALNAFNTLFGLVGAPIAAALGAGIGWGAMRAGIPPRAWSVAQAVVYPLLVYAYFTTQR